MGSVARVVCARVHMCLVMDTGERLSSLAATWRCRGAVGVVNPVRMTYLVPQKAAEDKKLEDARTLERKSKLKAEEVEKEKESLDRRIDELQKKEDKVRLTGTGDGVLLLSYQSDWRVALTYRCRALSTARPPPTTRRRWSTRRRRRRASLLSLPASQPWRRRKRPALTPLTAPDSPAPSVRS